ncbi:MAG: response regulator [Patescibacteria group bacterium]
MVNQKILLIEDDSTLAGALSQGLKDAGFDVITAMDGESGFNAAVEQKPALIVLDEILPKLEGLEVHKRLQAEESIRNIPVIMLTNVEDPRKVSQALEQGLKDYFIKADWSMADIVKKIKEKLAVSDKDQKSSVK